MKSIFRYVIFAAAAASAVLASCSKDSVVESNSGTAVEGLRTITLQFSTDTKVAFDGIIGTFAAGDKIKISNSERSEDATVWVENGIASITTNLTGFLTAVYPSTAANVTGSAPIGTPAYKVPAQQNGTPDNALIAVAKISGTSAVFGLQAALFEITPPSTATKITIKSLKEVVSGARTGAAAEINTDGSDKTVITVGTGSTNLPSTIYVAFNPGVKLTNLSFDAGETIGMKGIPTSTVGTNPDETVIKGKYKINNSNWHPYVTIGGLKWATMNVGATGSDPYGTYFSWGSVDKVYTDLSSNKFTFKTSNPDATRYTGTWAASSGFAVCNTPYYNGTSYSKYTGDDGKTVLELADDAAYVNWGGPWRMPTGGDTGDFKALDAGTTNSWGYEGSIYGRRFQDYPKTLFFPAAGRGYNTNFGDTAGYVYWSSSIYSSKKEAYNLFFDNTSTSASTMNYGDRFIGHTVRPVADL